MDLETYLAEIRKLQDKNHKTEIKLFEHLIAGEDEHRDLWKGAYKSFAEFLSKETHVNPRRYREYKVARNELGVPKAQELGVDGIIRAYKKKVGTTPRGKSIERLALELENAELRRENNRLKAENETLKKENERLRKKYEGKKAA